MQHNQSAVNFDSIKQPKQLLDNLLVLPDGTDFDPDALAELLRGTLDQLKDMGSEVDKNIADVSRKSKEKNARYQRQVAVHMESLQHSFHSMEQLEMRFNRVGSIAVRIGDNLSDLDGQRQRALDAKKLLKYLDEFQSSPDGVAGLSAVFSEPRSIHEAAEIIQQLGSITTGIDVSAAGDAGDVLAHIEKQRLRINDRLLEGFANAAGAHCESH